ncbi:MAG TPA: YqzM family protein [Paenibacillaceae bacterium]
MENARDPRLHVNEEPRNDFADVATGFAAMFTFMVVAFFGAVIIKALIS